jgi:BirA family biotin operon repressor/biotin-[acetyl-CoA-carboxylase] ligase
MEVGQRLDALLSADRRLALRIVEIESCGSTQDEARAAGAPPGTLWIAHEQTGGRGRSARDWWSGPPGANLAATLCLAPAPEPAPAALVMAACALAEVVEDCGAGPAAVKWPNDVLAGGAKVAGLLGEWLAGDPPRVLVGLGVNVAEAPPSASVRRTADSLAARLRRRGLGPPDRVLLLAGWLGGLERRWTAAQCDGYGALESEFLGRLRAWAPRGVRQAGEGPGAGGPLLEFSFRSGLAWESEGRILRRPLAAVADLEALP